MVVDVTMFFVCFFFTLGVELIPLTTTFLCCLLLNMEYGILIGAQVHLLLLAYEASRPVINIHCVDVRFRFIFFDLSLGFFNTFTLN